MPPTGAKCDFNPADLSLAGQSHLVKVTTPPGQGGTVSGSEDTEETVFKQVTDCLEGQQQQLDGLANEFSAMRTTVSELGQRVQQILALVTPGAGTPPFTASTPTTQRAGALLPLFGGVRPPSGPLLYSDSEGKEDCDSEDDHHRRRRKHKKPFDLCRHLPKGVRKPASIQQLVGALSRLQTVDLMILCNRAVMGIYSVEQLCSYDVGLREQPNYYDAQAFVFGDEEMINTHLVVKPKESAPTQSGGGGSGKKKKKKKNKTKFVPDPDSPCWSTLRNIDYEEELF